jgi:hypothetical protein
VLTKIRDLDFAAILDRVARATNPARRASAGGMFHADLQFVHSRSDAVCMLRDLVMLAALRDAKSLDDIQPDQPLVEAFVRVQHHPDARTFTRVKVQEGLYGPDAGPRLREIVAAHPELTWNPDEVQKLIITAIRTQYGDHELEDAQPPWLMPWSPASKAADALFALITFRTFGDL